MSDGKALVLGILAEKVGLAADAAFRLSHGGPAAFHGAAAAGTIRLPDGRRLAYRVTLEALADG